MKRFQIYIYSLLACLLFSCNDELSVDRGSDNAVDDSMLLSFTIDTPEARTRAIDMTPGASVFLKKIWVGIYVYDKVSGNATAVTGQRVGGTDRTNPPDLDNRLTAAGSKFYNVIPIQLYPTTERGTITTASRLVVVGVANYEGIKTTNGEDLYKALSEANTWDKFKDIKIDTQNSDFQNQTPLLMGYLINEDTDETLDNYIYTHVDQFQTGNGIYLDGSAVTGNTPPVFTYIIDQNNLNSTGKLLKFRRLRSKINVNLTTRDKDLTITNLQYKIVNQPKSSYLAQRRTNDFSNNGKTSAQYSPNSADAVSDGYITEDAWQKTTNNYSFSFEHFENIHWAKRGFPATGNINNDTEANSYLSTNYHERAKKNDDNKSFYYLVDSEETDWNNNASYILLKINLRDLKTGRNSEIEYTIHEGFCNDSEGRSLVDGNGSTKTINGDNNNNTLARAAVNRLKDYSCYRNTDYYYNVKINGVDDIVTTVTTNGDHPNDQNGKVWQMLYPEFNNSGTTDNNRIKTAQDANFTLKEPITVDFTTDENGKTVKFEDIAFRLVGWFYDDVTRQEVPVDLAYNFAHGEMDGYTGLWPDPVTSVTEYFVDTETTDTENDSITRVSALDAMKKYFNESHPFAEEMLERIKVNTSPNSDPISIKEFIEKLQKLEVSQITGVSVKGKKLYELADNSDGERNHMIGLYLFDRKKAIEGGDRVKTDNKDCYYYQVRAIEQYPVFLNKENFEVIYALNNNGNRIGSSGGTTEQINNKHININGGKNMIFSDNPDIAIRILGYYNISNDGETGTYYDLCYNFDPVEFPYFKMPETSSSTRIITKYNLSGEDIPTELLNGIKIQEGSDNNKRYNVKEFVFEALSGNLKSPYDYRFVFTNYTKAYYGADTRDKYMRAIYIFDKKNRFVQPVIYDESNNAATYQLYAAEQDGVYKAPVKLDNPAWATYSKTATYNIIEEFVGEITIPLLSGGYKYNEDYYYKLYTIDKSAGASNDRECKVEVDGTPSSGTITFKIPMNMAHANSRYIELQTIAVNDRLLSSDSRTNNKLETGNLNNPEWNFNKDPWIRVYFSWPTGSNSKYRYFSNRQETYSGSNVYPYNWEMAPITLYAVGSELRGFVDNITTSSTNSYLYFNSGSTSCSLRTPIYKGCKVSVTVSPSEGNTYTDRQINATAGSYSVSKALDSNSSKTYQLDKLYIEDSYMEELLIYFSKSVNVTYLKLTD